MNPATSTNLFGKCRDRANTPYLESVMRCSNAGFRVLDFSFVEPFFIETELNGDDWEAKIAEVADAAARLGIRFTQSHLPYNPGYLPTWRDEEHRQFYRECCRRAILGSAMLEVPWAVAHPFTACGREEYDDDASVECNREFYSEFIDLALKNGVGIAFENMIEYPQRRKFSARAEELAMLVDSFQDPRIGACWDFGHGHRMYRDLSRPVRILQSRLKALHVNDNTGISDLHHLPFWGTVNWEEALAALGEIGYQGDFTYEVYGITKLMPDVLRDHAAKMAYHIADYCLQKYQLSQPAVSIEVCKKAPENVGRQG